MRPLVCAVALLSSVATAVALERHAPRLVVESLADSNRVWVEISTESGKPERRLLRDTTAAVVESAAGWDPMRRAGFVNWREAGSRTWSSYTRNGGSSWSEPRPLESGLRLRSADVRFGDPTPAVDDDLTLPASGRLFLVQYRTLVLPEWKRALEERAAEAIAYFPHNAQIVRMSPSRVEDIGTLDFVERILPYHPAYRLEPELIEWLGGAAVPGETADGRLRVRVMAFDWGVPGKDRIADAAEALDAGITDYWTSGHVIELMVTRRQLRSLAAHDDVMWIDRWSPDEADMDLVREASGTNWLESTLSYCGQGVRGEVFDLGIQADHQDFDGILLHGSTDEDPHGTVTYGIVFGNGDRDGDGDARATGLMPCSGAQGIFADTSHVSDRFAHAQELKQDPYFGFFQTKSSGASLTTSYNSSSHEIDDIIWRLDIAITQSQSNSGDQDSRPEAWAKNVISVGGIFHWNNLDPTDDTWAGGASTGPAEDGRIKPDVHHWYDGIYATDMEPGGYTEGSPYVLGAGGTSVSTPAIAGILGLLVQMWSENVWGTNPRGSTVFERRPHASTIKALLINNAHQYDFNGTSDDLTRTHQGWGRPSVQLAAQRALRSFVIDETEPLELGNVAIYEALVDPDETELKVTLVYSDPPGVVSASLHRINDLNLKVTSPSGDIFHGNFGLDVGPYSQPGGAPNGVDTVENVFVAAPEAGSWTIEIEAAEVNQDAHLDTAVDDVVFALVVTGADGDCGNGNREADEQCDLADLGGASCGDLGCSGGSTSCTAGCTLDYSACSGCPTCDFDGVCETDENCGSCPDDCFAGAGAICGDGICDGDGESCMTCPVDCRCTGKNCGKSCCGDGVCANENITNCPVDCGGTVEPPVASCCGDGTCEGSEDGLNCEVDCGLAPFCGDAACNGDETSCTCEGDCGAPPPTEVLDSTCNDGINNDCDAAADCADSDCAGAVGCGCLPVGSPCSTADDCCSTKCKGPPGSRTCK